MSYLVLARKYRPQTFADVVGQEAVVSTLQNALQMGRVHHAFLFTGSRGIGKTTIARILAKALVCEKGISPNPCGNCAICKEVAAGSSLDVIEIDGASNTGVDDVRELREVIRYQPGSCRFKIFIIDEVHMLSTSAFNALLKTLEEPPPHAKFIFATTEAHKIPATILSRCQRYDFRRLPTAVIVAQLQKVLGEEKISISQEGLMLIAKAAEGGMRDALSLTDQVISFCGQNQATEQEVARILGLLDRQQILKATHALIGKDTKTALQIISDAFLGGYDPKQLIEGVAAELRHLAIAKTIGSGAGIADLSPDELKGIEDRAKNLDADDLQRLFGMALEGIEQVARSEQAKLQLELVFLRMAMRPDMAEAATIMDAIGRLESLKGPEAVIPGVTRNLEQTVKSKVEIPLPPPLPNPVPKVDMENGATIDSKWRGFVETCANQLGLLGHHLEHGRFVECAQEGGKSILKVEFKQKVHYQAVTDSQKDPKFLAVLTAYYGKDTELRLSFPDGNSTAPAPQMTVNEVHVFESQKAQEDLENRAKNDPLVQKALALFGGEIKAVKNLNVPPNDI